MTELELTTVVEADEFTDELSYEALDRADRAYSVFCVGVGFGFDWKPVDGDYSGDVFIIGEIQCTRWTYAMACPR